MDNENMIAQEQPEEMAVETPVETPFETPFETPVETPFETPVEPTFETEAPIAVETEYQPQEQPVDFWSADAPDYEPEPVMMMQAKPIYKQWWFWAIIAGVVVAAIAIGVVLSDGSGGSGGSSGYSYSAPSVSPYVTIVKTTKNSKYGITYGAAFDRFFTSPKWSYFKASSGEHVVEFTGGFLYDGDRATAKVQFIVDVAEGTLEVYHLSINGVAQSRLMLSALVQKVFESY